MMSRRNALILLFVTMVFWGTNFHVTKIALDYFSPMAIAAMRFFLAAVLLFGYLLIKRQFSSNVRLLKLQEEVGDKLESEYDFWIQADVFGMGCLIVEILSVQNVWTGKEDDEREDEG